MANKTLFFISESVSPSSHKLTAATAAGRGPLAQATGLRSGAAAPPPPSSDPIVPAKETTVSEPPCEKGFTASRILTPFPATAAAPASVPGNDLFQKRQPTLESRPSLLSRQLSRAAQKQQQQQQQQQPAAANGPSGAGARRRRFVDTDLYLAQTRPTVSPPAPAVIAFAGSGAPPPPAPPVVVVQSESLQRHVANERGGMLAQLQRKLGDAVVAAEPQVPYFSYKTETSIAW